MKQPTVSVCQQLRQLIDSPQLSFLLEAHNGLSARIVAEAGFQGIWGSGLSIAAQAGVRDNNELSWTQVLDSVELMADASGLPILLDGDTGYGDFNNVRRLVQKLEQAGGAGVCIEDKQFPKTNSLLAGGAQPLANIDEFCGKIMAAQDQKRDDDFVVVARVEALIAGMGLDEALKRAEAYRQAGADAILIHSRQPSASEILAFAAEWAQRSPLVIVPTRYYSTPTDVFRQAGIDLVIWANHMLRTSISAMQQLAATLYQQQSLVDIEEKIAPVNEVFRLQNAEELQQAERRYNSSARSDANAIMLGASRGSELSILTEDKPKVMVEINGKPLLRRVVDKLNRQGISDISLVAGYRSESIDVNGISLLHSSNYAESGELSSLACASKQLGNETLLLYGDLLFRSYMLEDLRQIPGEIVVVVDSQPPTQARDLAYCSNADDRGFYQQPVELRHISQQEGWQGLAPDGRFIGMALCRQQGSQWIRDALLQLQQSPDFASLSLPDLFNTLVSQGRSVRVLYINGRWLDVNNLQDLQRASLFVAGE